MKLLAASLVLSAFVLVLLCPQWASCVSWSRCQKKSCGPEEACVLDKFCVPGYCYWVPECVPKKDVPVCSAVCPPQQRCGILRQSRKGEYMYTPECIEA